MKLRERRLDYPTFIFAVVGAVVTLIVTPLIAWPLILVSWRFWVP